MLLWIGLMFDISIYTHNTNGLITFLTKQRCRVFSRDLENNQIENLIAGELEISAEQL